MVVVRLGIRGLHRRRSGGAHAGWRNWISPAVLLKYGITADERHIALACRVVVCKLVVEPARHWQCCANCSSGWRSGERLLRSDLDFAFRRGSLPGCFGDEPGLDDQVFRAVLGPRWRLLIVGAGQIARYLAPMAQAVGFEVTVCDPRFRPKRRGIKPLAPMVREMPMTICLTGSQIRIVRWWLYRMIRNRRYVCCWRRSNPMPSGDRRHWFAEKSRPKRRERFYWRFDRGRCRIIGCGAGGAGYWQ